MQYTRNNFPLWLFFILLLLHHLPFVAASFVGGVVVVVIVAVFFPSFFRFFFSLHLFFFFFGGPHFPSLHRQKCGKMRMRKRESIQFSLIIIADGKRFGKWNLCVFLFRALFDRESTHTMLKLTTLSVCFVDAERPFQHTHTHTYIHTHTQILIWTTQMLCVYWS